MNPDRLKNSQGKLWLNVASGNHLLEGFVNVDSNFLCFAAPIYPLVRPFLKAPARAWIEQLNRLKRERRFVYANCGKPLAFPPNSVDHILASHFLEHLYRDEAVKIVKSFYTMLKPGGTAHLIIPDIGIRAREYVAKIGDPQAADVFVESLTYHKRAASPLLVRILRITGIFDEGHHWMYDEPSFTTLVREAGFEILPVNETPSAQWRLTEYGQVNLALRKK